MLQDGEFTRVGGSEVIKTDVRVMLRRMSISKRAVDLGTFRQDLFTGFQCFRSSCRHCGSGLKTFIRS